MERSRSWGSAAVRIGGPRSTAFSRPCRALVQEPGLLLVDEPFGALDALTREPMGVDLPRMWSTAGNTVIFQVRGVLSEN